jgi:hypothetical protein
MRAPHRIRLSRRKGWRKPQGAIVVARPTKWGNPYSLDVWGRDLAIRLFAETARGVWAPSLLVGHPAAAVAVAHEAHVEWLRRLRAHPVELARVELAGHDLACWCALDQRCHADVLLEIANAR